MNFLAIGAVLIIWIGMIAAIAFNKNGKLQTNAANLHTVLPVTVALAIWMWIFGLVVFSA